MSFPHDVSAQVRYATLLATTTDAVLVTDDAGRAVEVNAAAARLFGLSEADLLGRTPTQVIGLSASMQAEILRTTRAGGRWTGEVTFVRPDGSTGVSEALVQGLFVDGAFVGTIGINRDVTEQRRLLAALAEAEQRWRLTLAHAPNGMAVVSLDGHLLHVNESLCHMLGIGESELTGTRFQDLTHPDDLSEDLEMLARLVNGEVPSYQLEKRYRHALGHDVWGHLCVGLVHDTAGEPLHFVAQVEDITNRRLDRKRLERLADSDAVTGLPNRRAFTRLVQGIATRSVEALVVGFLDLDDFKRLNDRHGHAAGDTLLRLVGRRLEAIVRPDDIAARLGGDEFAFALRSVADRSALHTFAARLLGSLAAPYQLGTETVHMSGSLGLAVMDGSELGLDHDSGFDGLLSRADAAMYRAKAAGKNSYVIW